MNFETKYILRYGIPGWIFLLGITSYLMLVDAQFVLNLIINGGTLSVVGIGAILAGIGVPVGYIFHLISMYFSWVIIKDWITFFEKEICLDQSIINKENGDKIRERYRYLLSQVHGLKTLLTSLILLVLTDILLMIFYKFVYGGLIVIITASLLAYMVNTNRKYSQSNLDHFLSNLDKFR